MNDKGLPVRKPVAYWTVGGKVAIAALALFNLAMIVWLALIFNSRTPVEPMEAAARTEETAFMVAAWALGNAILVGITIATRRTKVVEVKRTTLSDSTGKRRKRRR